MKRDLRAEIRVVLLANPDGMNIRTVMSAVKASDKSVRNSLSSMPDVYIDRWEHSKQGPPAAIYVAVVVPANCPRPTSSALPEAERIARREAVREYQSKYGMTRVRGKKKQVEEARRLTNVKAIKQAREANYESQGLTTIRGPWPTHA